VPHGSAATSRPRIAVDGLEHRSVHELAECDEVRDPRRGLVVDRLGETNPKAKSGHSSVRRPHADCPQRVGVDAERVARERSVPDRRTKCPCQPENLARGGVRLKGAQQRRSLLRVEHRRAHRSFPQENLRPRHATD